MATKIPYTYTEFKNCPEATEISHSRERGKVYHYLWCGLLFVLSILFCFIDSADRWIAVCGVVLCPIWFIYLIKFYDNVTNKEIKQALERSNEMNNKNQ